MKPKTHRGGLSPEKYLSKDELKQVMDYLQARVKAEIPIKGAKTDLMITRVFLGSGLRASELCDLTLQDLPTHHNKRVLYVRDGKGAVSRTVDISQILEHEISVYVNEFRFDKPPEAPLFANRNGDKYLYDTLRRKFREIGQAIKLPSSLHCHRFRHTFAIALYAKENDLLFVCQQLGHASIMTTQIYAKTTSEAARRQMEGF